MVVHVACVYLREQYYMCTHLESSPLTHVHVAVVVTIYVFRLRDTGEGGPTSSVQRVESKLEYMYPLKEKNW